MTITSVIKDGGRLVIVEDGITKTRSIVYDDAVCSLPPTGYTEVGVIYIDEGNSKLVIQYNGTTAEIELGAAGDLTGAEIVALLEAMAVDGRLEVTYLKDGTAYIKYTATEKAKLTGIESSAKDDQTGAEIIALLEALTAGNRLSHSKLDDVGASDHHSKYTNAEAKAAAVQAGVITNGVTKAPTHDAVYDVKATADAALPADEKYTNEDAVDAMGVKADDNPLNHDQAEEWGATEHTAIGDSTPHHAKYLDSEAVAAAKTVKLDDLTAPDDTVDLDFSTSLHGLVPKGVNLGKFLKDDGTWDTPAGGNGGYTEGARVYHNADQDVPNTTWTYLAFNSERYDTDTIHSTTVNNSQLVCKTAGKYLIVAQVYLPADGGGTARRMVIRLNGTDTIAYYMLPSSAVVHFTTTLSALWDMSVDDYVEMGVYQDSGDVLAAKYAVYYSPEFSMQRIG